MQALEEPEEAYWTPERYWQAVRMGRVMHMGGQNCEECGQPNLLDDKKCIKCGAELPTSKYYPK